MLRPRFQLDAQARLEHTESANDPVSNCLRFCGVVSHRSRNFAMPLTILFGTGN
jgi:hypothetical protein